MHDTQDEPIVRSTEAAGRTPERPDEPVVAPPTASEAEPTIEAEPGPQAEQAAEPAAELAPEPASDVELTAEPEPPAAPEPPAEPEPQPVTEPEPSAEAEAQHVTAPEPPAVPEAQPVPEPEPLAEAEAQPVPEPEHTAEPPAEPEPAAELAAGSEAESAQVVATPTVRRTVSQAIAQQLHAAGARYCFTVPAEPILPLLDDLAETGIRVVTTRHEGSAAFMAEALAQLTGRPHIVAVSRAVGAANAAVGIHTALQDSAPLVALAGQVETGSLGREAFQEADLVASVGSLASWAAQIDEPDAAPSILAKARRRLETGRPGPLLLSVPRDVQQAEIEVADGSTAPLSGSRGPAADRSAVSRAMKMLAGSERGVIVAGAGVLRARAGKRLVALSEAMAIPVIAAWRRPDVFPNDHVNFLGMAGSGAAATVGPRLADADVILFIGTRLSEISTGGYRIPAPDTRWIHVDVQPRVAHAGLTAPTLSISADAARFLDSAWSDLRAAALDNEMRSRREARNAADREAYKAASATGLEAWHGPGAHPGLVVRVLRAVLPDNAVITTDSGNLAAFVARAYRFRRAGTFIGATSGSMGYGLPAAIAASLHEPDRIAVAVCGDGGFAMTAPELETAVREGAHPIVVVLDNQRYGMIADQQLRLGRSTRQSELGPIDFAAVARAHGALGFSVADDAGFEAALREAIGSRQASVIHVSVDPAWRSVDDNPVTPAS